MDSASRVLAQCSAVLQPDAGQRRQYMEERRNG